MSKLSRMSHVTPLPATVTREAAIAHLHNHQQMIELNPLVMRHARTTPPTNAPSDEAAYMTWYEITDKIQYIPGTPIKGEVSYKAGFYDVENGLQTHTFAPGGVDIRGKWTVGGNAPGEEREEVEIGTNKPRDGLYIQEDVDLRCNVFFSGFVKKNLKKSHGTVVDSIVEMAIAIQASESEDATPGHVHPKSDTSFATDSRTKSAADGASVPTSYSQIGSDPCSCPMAAFGVHMETCDHHSPVEPSGATVPEQQPANVAAELEGNPLSARRYYASRDQNDAPAG